MLLPFLFSWRAKFTDADHQTPNMSNFVNHRRNIYRRNRRLKTARTNSRDARMRPREPLVGSLLSAIALTATKAQSVDDICYGPLEPGAYFSNYERQIYCDPIDEARRKCAASYLAGGDGACVGISGGASGGCYSGRQGVLVRDPISQESASAIVPCAPSTPPPPPPPEALCAQAQVPTTPVQCAATADVLLVVDSSSSVLDIRSQMTQFMKAIAARFDLDPSQPAHSPRLGIILFNGPPGRLDDFAQEDVATVLVPLTTDAAQIDGAIDSRPIPSGTTCISCGLLRAQQTLAARADGAARPLAPAIVVVLTDGQQTVGGDDQTAIAAASRVKADGHVMMTIGFGDAQRQTMEAMASPPAASYALDAYTLSSACPPQPQLLP